VQTLDIHAIGFVGDTTQQAADDFYPGHARLFGTVCKERGWPPPNRAQFDATRGPTGAYIMGDVDTVVKKNLYVNEVPEGVSRINF